MKKIIKYFTPFEWALFLTSLAVQIIVALTNKENDILNTICSLVGASGLIFLSKGNVIGQFITVVYSILYSIVAYRFSYYGEMITYLYMTLPIALLSIVTWLRHPQNKNEVKIAKLTTKKIVLISIACATVTVIFYFILKAFNTPNLIFSTLSIATTFYGAALMALRSRYYAVAYVLHDIVIIVLWVLATIENIGFLTMIICSTVFLINDTYGFINWKKIEEKQQ